MRADFEFRETSAAAKHILSVESESKYASVIRNFASLHFLQTKYGLKFELNARRLFGFVRRFFNARFCLPACGIAFVFCHQNKIMTREVATLRLRCVTSLKIRDGMSGGTTWNLVSGRVQNFDLPLVD